MSINPKKPIVLDNDGIFGQLANGALINAGGTTHLTFTVGGRGLLFDDGTSTNPEGGIALTTLQTVYDNTEAQGGQAQLKITTGKDFAILNDSGSSVFFKVDAATGKVTLSSQLEVAEFAVFSQNISVGGTINGVNLQAFKSNFDSHVTGSSPRHEADDIDITPIAGLGGATNVQTALEVINSRLSDSVSEGYEHVQDEAAEVWIINHNKGTRRVQTVVYDSDWEQIIPDTIQVTDVNTITITFGSVLSGRAMVILF
jgi:hypothetical protein